ncbi:hypothetical protein [Klebsiella africana]|uniref:hypothetical protein n=1 Tax=Klebsiella africana TaxID=2489010 RepID=UPI001933D715|nr:hypothetical protein [Klebsiella africana]QRF14246.1 hypothetical protein H1X61_08750 [Klebsiella africana]
MFNSRFGPFDGSSWEALCQQIFKRKYQEDDYQPIPASPGDFGLEGFTLKTGWGFQCYCPDKHYERSELYEKQRDKITADLGKLKTYQTELLARLGSTQLTHWVFVTPEFDRNSLISHARTKEELVRSWNLPFISDDFTILLYDGDNYIIEINEIRSALGESLIFDDVIPVLAELESTEEEYEKNIKRKSIKRLSIKSEASNFTNRVHALSQHTLESFLSCDGYFRRIESTAPAIYVRLVRLINEFENYVVETSYTWTGTAEELTLKVRDSLEKKIKADLSPEFDETNASKVSRLMTARWLAICELDYD